jgi:multidrug transporter EmrE-like cation transporter
VTAFVYSIALVIASQVTYQLAVKAVPRDSNPFGVLILVYGLAMIACVALAPLAGKPIAFADMKRFLSWPACLLALAVVGIEVGYLLAYRNGWTLGITFAVTSVAAVTLLALLGAAWFGEHIDGKRVLGLVLALAAGWLIVA